MMRASLLAGMLLAVGGCGGADYAPGAKSAGFGYSDGASDGGLGEANAANEAFYTSRTDTVLEESGSMSPASPVVAVQQPGAEQPAPVQRKIIYNAGLSIVVTNLETAKQEIKKLVDASGGYLAQFSEQRTTGDRLSGRWVVRVPSSAFDQFLEDAQDLGTPESQHIETNEVTDQFVDLDARLSALRRVEEEMLEVMEKSSGNVADVLQARKQLGDVRVEIERIEGQLRKLTDLVAMSTVTIDAREDANYTPPQAPTFAEQIAQTFGGSLTTLQAAGRGLVLAAVALIPWLITLLVIFGLPLLVLIAVVRRRQPRSA